ncbi:MAG: hypothetical protein WAO78_18315, partial [Roseovarius sp.]
AEAEAEAEAEREKAQREAAAKAEEDRAAREAQAQQEAERQAKAEAEAAAEAEAKREAEAEAERNAQLAAEAEAAAQAEQARAEEAAREAQASVQGDANVENDMLARLSAVDETALSSEEDDDEIDTNAAPQADDTLAQLMADAFGGDAETTRGDNADMAENSPIAARMVKVKRADLDAALGGADGVEEGASLSPEEEADLQRELAEVEAELTATRAARSEPEVTQRPTQELSDDAPEAMSEETAEASEALEDDIEETQDAAREMADTEPSTESKKAALGTIGSDAQTSRIFDETDSQLKEPESNERRNAIQHLRAAVAATKAEQNAGGAMAKDVDDQPYRLDLENAVRPRRPRATGVATPRPDRPGVQRPAPLKLVAEQRIDTDAAPIRPRRVVRARPTESPMADSPETQNDAPDITPQRPQATSQSAPQAARMNTTDTNDSFAEFADAQGAKSLPELLEAAAAYMADVEGMPQFSRPMLMQKLREMEAGEFSREEGLRSFGQLLREGKLQKLKGGRFAVTDETDFRRAG